MKKQPKKAHRYIRRISLYTVAIAMGAIISFVILYFTRGLYYLTVNMKTASITGYETLPISIAKWELGVAIFIIGAIVYNYSQKSLERKKNMEWSYVLIGLMTQGAVLAIGAY